MPTIKLPPKPALSRNTVDVSTARRMHKLRMRRMFTQVDQIVDAALRRALRPVTAKLEKPTLLVAAARTSPEAFLSLDDAGYVQTAWRDEVGDLMTVMEQSFMAGGESVAQSIGGVFMQDMFSSAAQDYLANAENRLVGIGDTMWTDVRSQLLEGFQNGDGIIALRNRVNEVASMTSARATAIARTEVIGATNAGGLQEAREQGVGYKTWLATDDDRTRQSHIDVDGSTVAVDEFFDVGGYPGSFPGDPNLPPEEGINCRCTLTWADNEDGEMSDYCACTPDFESMTAADEGAAEFPIDCDCANSEPSEGELIQSGSGTQDDPWEVTDNDVAHLEEAEAEDLFARHSLHFNDPAEAALEGDNDDIKSVFEADFYDDVSMSNFEAEELELEDIEEAVAELKEATQIILRAHGLELDDYLAVYGPSVMNPAVDPFPVLQLTNDEQATLTRYSTKVRDVWAAMDQLRAFNTLAANEVLLDPKTLENLTASATPPDTNSRTDAVIPSAAIEEDTMPWHIVQNSADCPASRPWAVVKDDDGSVEGCHDTEDSAKSQLAALNAAEGDAPNASNGAPTASVRRRRGQQFADAPALEPMPAEAPVAEPSSEIPPPDAVPTSMIYFEGAFDMHGSYGREAQRLVGENFLRGVSVSLDDVTDNDIELIWPEAPPEGEDIGLEDLFMEPELAIFTHGRIVDGTLTPQPALQEAYIELDPNDPTRFRGVCAVEGKPTGDGRMFADNSLEWRDLPLALMWQEKTDDGHDSSVLVGRIESLERKPYVSRSTSDAVANGEAAPAPPAAASSTVLTFAAVPPHDTPTDDGPWDAAAAETSLPTPMPMETADAMYAWIDDSQATPDGVPKSACKFPHHDVTDGTPGAANLTACSAAIGALNGGHGGADIPDADRQGVYDHVAQHLNDAQQTPPPLASLNDVAQLSAGAPTAPPRSWFENPGLTGPTPLVVSDDGRVYGHLARWGTCHTSFPGTCVTPPREESYDYFTTGEVVCADGSYAPVGQLTLGTGHAAAKFGARPAVEHYDHSGHAVADVMAGSDDFGIWVAGAVRPGTPHEDVHTLRASALSGDWRRIGGKLRLVAALCVNVPGFPIPRARAHVHDSVQVALVAAGMVMPSTPTTARAIDRIAATIGRDKTTRNRERVESLAARVHQS